MSFPGSDLHFISWIALIPLLYATRDISPQKSFKLGFLAGFVHYISLLYWLTHTLTIYGYLPFYLSAIILLLLTVYLALYIGIFSGAIAFIRPSPPLYIFLIPSLWVFLEFVRSHLLSGFPWELLGYSQYKNSLISQFSDIAGVLGISFLISFTNAILFFCFLYIIGKKWKDTRIQKRFIVGSTCLIAIVITGVLFYGTKRIKYIEKMVQDAPHITFAAIQGNIDQAVKWDNSFQYSATLKHLKLSQKTRTSNPNLIVWPETSAPFYFEHDIGLAKMVKRRIKETETYYLIGCPSFVKNGNDYHYLNSAVLIDPEGEITDQYDKVHLVPYGEYVPFKKWFPFLDSIVEQSGDFKPGTPGKTLDFGGHKIGTQICFEIIFPTLSRQMARNGAEVIVNITNDAWFGRSSAPYQHFSMTVFRAIENRRSLVRAANTGISGFISPTGKIIKATPLYRDAAVCQSLPLLKSNTFYSKNGDILPFICFFIVAIITIVEIKSSKE